MTTWILTAEAEADLRGIIRYTRKQWGTAQARRYIARQTGTWYCLPCNRASPFQGYERTLS
ncbi:type II toxin-antitoxin system RelE/ParE family toxin [Salmonella enterica]